MNIFTINILYAWGTSNMGIEIYLNEKCNLSNKNFIICLFLFNQIIIFHMAKKGMKKVFFLVYVYGQENEKSFGNLLSVNHVERNYIE